MGWYTDAKNWVQGILEHETTAAIGNSFYDTAVYTFQQIATFPKVARSVLFHPSTNKVAKHLLQITVDLVPLVLVNFTNQLIQERGRAYLDDRPDSEYPSAETVLQAGLYLLKTAAWVYSVRQQTQLAVHMAIVTIETTPMANSIKASTPTICDNKCSPIQGSVRDLAAYIATEVAISFIGYAPGVGERLAYLLGILHKGRYITFTGTLSGSCNDHQITYLKQYPELALSLGLTHAASSALITSLIKNTTGIPTSFYASAIDPIMLIVLMIVAAHMDLPAAPRTSTRRTIDPVGLYQSGVGLVVDTGLLGLRTQIPRMLKGKKAGNVTDVIRQLPWEAIGRTRMQIQQHPITRLLLPPVLHDLASFVDDPLVRSNWPVVQAALVNAMKMIESLRTNYVLRLSSSAPGVSSSLVEAATGTPRIVTKLVLQLLTDEQVHKFIRATRIQIEMLGRAAEATMVASYEMVDPTDTTPPGDSPIAPLAAASAGGVLPSPLTLPPLAPLLPAGSSTSIVPRATITRHLFFVPAASAANRDTHETADTSAADWVLVDPHSAITEKAFGKTA